MPGCVVVAEAACPTKPAFRRPATPRSTSSVLCDSRGAEIGFRTVGRLPESLLTPVPEQRWQVGPTRTRRSWTLTVISIPQPPILVRNVAPAEVRQWSIRSDSQGLDRINTFGSDGAQVLPLITEVEHVGELLADLQLSQLDSPVIQYTFGNLVLTAGNAQ